jgi:hypothetical protein
MEATMKRVRWVLAGCVWAAAAAHAEDRVRQQRVEAQVQELQVPALQIQNAFGGAMRRTPGFAQNGRVGAFHEPFEGPLTAAKVQRAVDDAVRYFRAHQAPDGAIAEGGYAQGGYTSLAALTLLAAGASPETDDGLRKALNWLAGVEVDNTYVRAIRANVWEYALRKAPYDTRLRDALRKDYDWLVKALGDKEGWRYSMGSTDWDNSVTQYGVLGVWAAARAGIEPGDEFWVRMSRHFRKVQNPDGGWGYTGSGSTANMATAGLATMFLVFDKYHGKSFYSRENPRAFSSGDAAECLVSIEKGMRWLGQRGGGYGDGYYLYGIERTGVAGGRKYIGDEDWFAKGALEALRRQTGDGAMPLGGHGGVVGNTAFATLFLVYGGAPVAFGKLQWGDGQTWNLNPRDLANVAKHLWSAYERPLNWHVVSVRAPAAEFEAPILFVSGAGRAALSDADVAKLREYVEGGGTILAEPSDRDPEFAAALEALPRRMFPEKDYPEYRLAPLPPDHGLFTVTKQDWQSLPRLRGVSDGSRTFFLLSDGYLSADWQMDRTDSDAFRLAMNLLFYATDLRELEGRFASVVPEGKPAAARERKARVARLKHAGGGEGAPMDWVAGPECWRRFAPYAKHICGSALEETAPVSLADGKAPDVEFLHVTGRRGLKLGETERAALKAFVEKGGTVLVDAYAGSRAFAEQARAEIEAVFGPLSDLTDDSVLASGKFLGGSDLTRGIRASRAARRAMREKGGAAGAARLKVVTREKRPAVLFSELDLTAALAGVDNYQSMGYRPDSARRIVGNLVAYATAD